MEEEQLRPQPLYCLSSKTYGRPKMSEFDVCIAATQVIKAEDLRGVQRVGNLWRIYANSL